jgi:alkanesulfonate monooxygenase SsuD/methylene tetrahydromethanopterin reductase-like flavin-dependent oxidoreductase (luciferase family)
MRGIGGAGERRTLRLVARYADACNLFDIPDGGRTVRRKLEVLARHCDDVGRPYDAIVRSHLLNPAVVAPTRSRLEEKVNALPPIYRSGNSQGYGTPQDLIEYYRALIEAGAQYLIVNLATYDDLETLELIADEILPAPQGLGA